MLHYCNSCKKKKTKESVANKFGVEFNSFFTAINVPISTILAKIFSHELKQYLKNIKYYKRTSKAILCLLNSYKALICVPQRLHMKFIMWYFTEKKKYNNASATYVIFIVNKKKFYADYSHNIMNVSSITKLFLIYKINSWKNGSFLS